MRRCSTLIRPMVSNRMVGSDGEDFVVAEVCNEKKFVRMWDVRTSSLTVCCLLSIIEQLHAGDLKIAASWDFDRNQAGRPLNTRSDGAATKALYCRAIDHYGARFALDQFSVEEACHSITTQLEISPPCWKEVLNWWRLWVFADRDDVVFEYPSGRSVEEGGVYAD